jgi:serine/threonine-protein kinase
VAVAVVIALLVVLPPEGIWQRIRVQEPDVPEAPPRILVLPFEYLGPAEEEFFADGMTEEILNRLAAVSGLAVISRTSAMHYKGKDDQIHDIADELDVDYVLEGTVRWDRSGEGGGRVRITPQLIQVSDDTHLWVEVYDRVFEEIFEVQIDIAGHVIEELRLTLLEPERRAIEAIPTENMAAYHAYLRGVDHRQIRGPDWARLSLEMLERAVELDPEFALAHAALSLAHGRAFYVRSDLDPERLARAKRAADRALELDPSLPEGHVALGWFFFASGDPDQALVQYREALALRPNDAEALAMKAFALRAVGQWGEAVDILELAVALDPQNDRTLNWLAGTYMVLRRHPEAAVLVDRAIAIAPGNADAWTIKYLNEWGWHGPTRVREVIEEAVEIIPVLTAALCGLEMEVGNWEAALACWDRVPMKVLPAPTIYWPRVLFECACYKRMGEQDRARQKCEEARSILEERATVVPGDAAVRSALGITYALLGRKDDAIREGERAVELQPVDPQRLVEVATIYTIVGEAEAALDTIEDVLSIPSEYSVTRLRHSSRWDRLRDHPRFADILDKYDTGQ